MDHKDLAINASDLSGTALIERILNERHSLLNRARLDNLARRVRRSPPHGALVECGVGRGGALALMAAARSPGQHIWGFDSFEAMPALTERDDGDGQAWVGFSVAGPQGAAIVDATFASLGLPLTAVTVVAGWFEETLPGRADEIGPISVLRLDSDWYEATRFCLDHLYGQVLDGGVVIIDDYHTFVGCRRAVDEFRSEHGITAPLTVTDAQTEVWWSVGGGA